MSYAYNGERLFDTAVTGFSVAAALYMEQVQIVTTNPDIQFRSYSPSLSQFFPLAVLKKRREDRPFNAARAA